MRKINIINKTAGLLDFMSKKPTVPAEKWEEFKELKDKIFVLYKKMNNAYKIYFQGAVLKSAVPSNENKQKEITPQQTNKIDFIGNWKFKLGSDQTSLGQAIQSLYQFLTKLETVTVAQKNPAEKKPEKNQEQKKPGENPSTEETDKKKTTNEPSSKKPVFE